MYTIVMRDDKSLRVTQKTTLYQREKLVDKIEILIPQQYEEMDLSEFTAILKYLDQGNVAHASGALKSAAFAETTAFDAVGTASSLVTELQNGAVATNTSAISALDARIDTLKANTYTAITEEEITALFSA